MKKRIEKSIQLVQKYKVDVLELGEVYKRHNYKEWKKISKDWDQARIILVMLKLMFTLIQQLNIQVQHYQRK